MPTDFIALMTLMILVTIISLFALSSEISYLMASLNIVIGIMIIGLSASILFDPVVTVSYYPQPSQTENFPLYPESLLVFMLMGILNIIKAGYIFAQIKRE